MCNALVVPCKQCTWQRSLDDVGCVRPKSTGGYCKHGNTFHSLDYSLLTVEMYGQMKKKEDNEFTNRRKQHFWRTAAVQKHDHQHLLAGPLMTLHIAGPFWNAALLTACTKDSTDCLMHPYIQGAFNVPCTHLHWSPIDSPSKNHTPISTIVMTMGV